MKVLVTGATGMIGSLVLKRCLENDKITDVVSLVRRQSGVVHEKYAEFVLPDFLDLKDVEPILSEVDVVYYCLGAYTGNVDRETLRKVTVDYPDALANLVAGHNPEVRFCLLSGAGADRTGKSRTSFARDKGEIENRLSEKSMGSFHTFRPGYIYPVTPRNEPGFGYRLMRWMYPVVRLFGDGASIQSSELADAMFKVGLAGHENEVIENRDILRIVKS